LKYEKKKRGVKELTPECDLDEFHEQFTHAERNVEREREREMREYEEE